MARIWAENSYCKRRQVGALVVKDKMIISDGYNGTPSGFEISAKKMILPSRMFSMQKLMPSPNWQEVAIIATAVHSTLPLLPA